MPANPHSFVENFNFRAVWPLLSDALNQIVVMTGFLGFFKKIFS